MSGLAESLRAARRWDTTRDNYAAFGLCDRCAAQAAWGHSDGFAAIHPPCISCTERVTVLPVEQVNGWRSVPRGDSPRHMWPSPTTDDESLPATA